MSNDGLSEDYGDLGEKRNRRMRIVAWTVISRCDPRQWRRDGAGAARQLS
ncbi:hypothetical protein JM654_23725, partial [Microbacterium oxydans]|nr:hypothetical protein [Microbacterium oxydans]